MKKVLSEFQAFLLKQNVIALAIGVVIGAAVGKVVSGLVDDVIMPIVGTLLPAGGDWRSAQFTLTGTNAIKYGDLIGRVLDFLIVATVVFLIVKLLIREAPPPATKTCAQCLETIPAAATRCRACTSPV
jgi:large conductance mechanosensitive channel